MRDDLYKVMKSYKDAADKDGSFQQLDSESKRYVEKTMEGMEETGLKLNKEQKLKYLDLKRQIHDLENKARGNLNSDKSKFEAHEKELDGIEGK